MNQVSLLYVVVLLMSIPSQMNFLSVSTFFGDDIETIRNFEVETQLSTEKLTRVEIVPELTTMSEEKVPFLQFLPEGAVLAFKDFLYVRDAIDNIYQEGFTNQALTEKLEGKTELEQRELEVAFRKEGQLVPASRWMNDALDFRRIELVSIIPPQTLQRRRMVHGLLLTSVPRHNHSSTRTLTYCLRPFVTIFCKDINSISLQIARSRQYV